MFNKITRGVLYGTIQPKGGVVGKNVQEIVTLFLCILSGSRRLPTYYGSHCITNQLTIKIWDKLGVMLMYYFWQQGPISNWPEWIWKSILTSDYIHHSSSFYENYSINFTAVTLSSLFVYFMDWLIDIRLSAYVRTNFYIFMAQEYNLGSLHLIFPFAFLLWSSALKFACTLC